MKKNILNTMNNLGIDEGIRGLVKQLWKHNYRTKFSCDGHNEPDNSEIIFFENTGDGWFEENAQKYGLHENKEGPCCENVRKIDTEWSKNYGKEKTNFCWECGHWFNGYKKYSGSLIPYPFRPEH